MVPSRWWGRRGVEVGLTLCGFVFAALPEGVRGEAWPEYQAQGSFPLPPGADVFDVLGDGRVIVLVNANVYLETALRSQSFVFHGTLADAPSLEFPSFLRVSPGGTLLAVGDGVGLVGIFDIATLTGRWIQAAHYEAEWYDDRHLALTGGVGGSVTMLDTQSPDALSPVNPTIVVNTGVPGGVAFDAEGHLFTGNGFSDSGPIETGDIKRFSLSAWSAAWLGGTPLDFVTDGTLVVNVLSAASLGFDSRGNLHVGGGDFLAGTELDFVAIVRESALAKAAGGAGTVDVGDSRRVQRLDPDGSSEFDFYSVMFSRVTNELYVQNFGESTVHRYANVAIVPAASAWGLWTMSLLVVTGGCIVLRERARRGDVEGVGT